MASEAAHESLRKTVCRGYAPPEPRLSRFQPLKPLDGHIPLAVLGASLLWRVATADWNAQRRQLERGSEVKPACTLRPAFEYTEI